MSVWATRLGSGWRRRPGAKPQSGLLLNRLSVTNLEDLKRRILRVIAHCNKPKVTKGTWGLPTQLSGTPGGCFSFRALQPRALAAARNSSIPLTDHRDAQKADG